MRQFNSEGEFLAALGDPWVHQPGGAELRAALSAGISQAETEVRQDGDGSDDAALDLRLKGWVLRTEDMPVAEAIGIVAAALTAATGPVGITAAAVVTAVSSFAALCWKAWRKGAPLSRNEIALLGLLRLHGPMTEDDLASKAVAQFPEMTPGDVMKNLQSLGDVNLRDGTVVTLVRRDASGRWVAQGA
jgi:hypothetical protein